MSELLILLGAGASMPYISGTNQLTDHLLHWKRYREPHRGLLRRKEHEGFSPEQRDHYDEVLNIIPDTTDARKGIFEALRDVLHSGSASGTAVNFEELIYLVELLSDYYPLTNVRKIRPLFSHFISPKADLHHWDINTIYSSVIRDASMEILNKISFDCDNQNVPHSPIVNGLLSISRKAKLRLFSLNYDDVPLNTGIDFYTGYDKREKHEGIDFDRFLPKYPWPSENHTFCQLHGSVLFGYHPIEEYEIVRFPDRAVAQDRRQRILSSGGHLLSDGSKIAEFPLITGMRKSDKILTRPYGAYYHIFRDELLRCNKWLIVGYGFGDHHINQAILQARRNWRIRGDTDFRAGIVDYCDFKAPPPVGVSSSGFKIADHIMAKWGNSFSDDTNMFLTKTVSLDSLIKQDELNSVSDQLSIYFNGTDKAFTTPSLEKIVNFLNL